MDIFDSMEPWRQAEQLAADADFREAVLPKCSRCGQPIAEPMVLCIETDDRKDYYCPRCIESMTIFNEEAEVW